MKADRIITTFTGSQARLYADGLVIYDFPSGRAPVFMHILIRNHPEIDAHFKKIMVDGIKSGSREGYVLDVEGMELLVDVFDKMESKGTARIQHTKALVKWMRDRLIPEMHEVRKAAVVKFEGSELTILVGGALFRVTNLGPDQDRIKFVVNGNLYTASIREFCRDVELLK